MNTSIRTKTLGTTLFSKARGAVLALLYGHAEESFYLRQIARVTGAGLGPVQRELKLLTEAGIVRRTVSGRQVYYRVNTESPVFPELKSLVAKTAGIGDTLRAALSPIADRIKVAFVYGSVARGEGTGRSDVDVLVVGDVAFAEVVAALQGAQETLGREINPTVFPVAEISKKLSENVHFLRTVLAGPKIFLTGTEIGLNRLAAKRLARRA